MPNTPTTEDIKQAAQALFIERVGAVTALADATRERAAKQAEAAEAEQREVAAWAGALRQGWTEDDLKGMGLVAPGRKSAARARSRRRTAAPGRQRDDLLGAPSEASATGSGAQDDSNGAGDDAAQRTPAVGG